MSGWQSTWRELFVPETGTGPSTVPTVTELLNGYLPILLVAFVATLATVPIFRWLAIRFGVIDRPDGDRKIHRLPIAYLGGAAVFTGILAGIVSAEVFWAIDENRIGEERLVSLYPPVTYAVVFGMLAIFATGVLDDIFHWDPRLKLAGQFVAAAGLAMTDFGTNAVSGLLAPLVAWSGIDGLLHPGVTPDQPVQVWDWATSVVVGRGAEFLPWMTLEGAYYWVGVGFIAMVVLGASNSANLIDGLDGLLSGTVGLMAVGFIAIGVMLAVVDASESVQERALGIEIAELFANEDWDDPGTVELLDFPTPVLGDEGRVVAWLPGDGRVDIHDLRAVLGDPDHGDRRVHAEPSPALQARLGIEPSEDATWAPSFRGKDRLLAAFDPELRIPAENDLDSVLAFDLVAPELELIDVLVGLRGGVVDQADFREWVELARVLEEPRDPLAGSRLVIAFALLGACLGFLPYNFNPAVIFLGDAGSLLMGYLCGVLILSLGSEGQTHYVIAGLIIFALPIMDTVLAILRRKLSGLPMSAPDKNHIHHMTLRSLGSVKKAVFALYALDLAFVAMGVGLAATVAIGGARYLLVYGVAIVVFGMVGTMATKAALRQRWMMQLQEAHGDGSEGTTEPVARNAD